ncbi:MAG: bfeA [Gemmatimonadetes bacterium]|nr:bfeA [Gemmatimonadota bacterium]
MRRIPAWFAGAVLALSTLAVPLAAQEGGSVEGRVLDVRGAPVAAARVAVRGTSLAATTGADGRYRIAGIPAGPHTLVASAISHAPSTGAVQVRAGQTASADFTLQVAALALEGVQAIVGSRAQHTAANELAVPVDVFPAAAIQLQGTTETAQILSSLSPSVNFPHQSVSDGTDIVRPFTMRGLSPDHTLVLLNGKRYHQTALVHIFGAGMGAGSAGVDMNTIPASAVERLEVLRDGAAAQYGSDAIAGVVNLVMKRGAFAPTVSADVGGFAPDEFRRDGRTVDASGGWGIPVGLGSVGLFFEYRDRAKTNRAGPDPEDQLLAGDHDSIADYHVIDKRNSVAQPTYHWGDGEERDALTFVNAVFPFSAQHTTELYASGGFSHRHGTGNGYFRHGMDARNWPTMYPLGFLPAFEPRVIDYTGSGGVRGSRAGWTYDLGATVGHNAFRFDLGHTLNTSLGPCFDTPCAPGLDGVLGTADDPGIPNKTSIFAGELRLSEAIGGLDVSRAVRLGLPSSVNVAAGVAVRHESYAVVQGELASYVQGGHLDRYGDPAPAGSQVFPGFSPSDASRNTRNNVGAYLDLETNLTDRLLVNAAGRFEHYSDFGRKLTEKLAVRFQPTERLTLRGAVSTGFRAPSLSQSFYSSTVTDFRPGPDGKPEAFSIGIFPVHSKAAQILGARPLRAETSLNASGGLAFSPLPNLNFTADYFFIAVDGRILLTTYLGTDSIAALLARNGLDAEAGQYFTNAIDTHTRGVDLNAQYRMAMGTGRALDLSGNFNWTENRITNKDHLPLPAELVGKGVSLFDEFGEGGLLAMEKERPAWRSTLTGTYSAGGWSALARESLYGKYTSALYCYCAEGVQTYAPKGLLDLEIGRGVQGRGKLSVGVKNLFDTFPGKMRQENSFGVFQYPPASPFGYNGRYLYTRFELTLR